ncbi:MAG: DUF6174 domain-containing protein [Treponema sp.]|nr:DUF6174 domain-containing protein [Treponema sp.]
MKKVLLAAMVSALLYACDSDPQSDPLPAPRLAFDGTAFESARLDWNSFGITDYTFEVDEFHAGPKPIFRVTVRDGEISSIEVVGKEWMYDANSQYDGDRPEQDMARIREIGTIPAIFDWIDSLREAHVRRLSSAEKGVVYTLNVTYNNEHGFPEKVKSSISSLDSSRQPDGGYYYLRISNFRLIAK